MKNRLSVDYFYSKIIVEEIQLSPLVHFHSVISLAVVVNSEYETKGLPTWLGSWELVPWNWHSLSADCRPSVGRQLANSRWRWAVLHFYRFVYILSTYTCQLFLRYKREIFILGVLGFLKTTWSFPKIPEEVRSLPKKSEVFWRRPKSAEGKVIEKTLIHKIRDRKEGIVIYSFYTWFSFLTWSELTYFWKLCQARRQQLTVFNQVWELAHKRKPAWDRSFQPAGVRLTPKAWELAGISTWYETVHIVTPFHAVRCNLETWAL